MIEALFDHYRPDGRTMLAGTGDSPLTVPFYQSCGFVYSHRIPNFFIEHYDHPIIEAGRRLTDMLYFKRDFKNSRNRFCLRKNADEKNAAGICPQCFFKLYASHVG